jgi:hypothetical protein
MTTDRYLMKLLLLKVNLFRILTIGRRSVTYYFKDKVIICAQIEDLEGIIKFALIINE